MALTVAQRLIDLLGRESIALKARDYEAIEALRVEKETLMAQLDEQTPLPELRKIQERAEENTRQFTTLISAVRSVRDRFLRIDEELTAVGYSAQGDKLSCSENNMSRRV